MFSNRDCRMDTGVSSSCDTLDMNSRSFSKADCTLRIISFRLSSRRRKSVVLVWMGA